MSAIRTPLPHLHRFISDHLEELVVRTRARVAQRGDLPSNNGVRLLLVQLAGLLQQENLLSGAAHTSMQESAQEHGRDWRAAGMSIGQVVNSYGDICQVITELCIERNVAISAEDFRAFNGCLDVAIAEAVTEYSRARDRAIASDGVERLGELVHELRNELGTAMLSFDAIKSGVAGTHGSVASLHTRSLGRLRDLLDRSFSEVRLDAQLIKLEEVIVPEFIEEAEVSALFQAKAHNLELFVSSVAPTVTINVDRQMLAGALANLLQNAFKFSRPDSLVSLNVHVSETRVFIDVQDECGGLPPGKIDQLFLPFKQHGANRSGLGLGLAIAKRAVEANSGELRVVDLPLLGCRFTIDLPRGRALV